MHVMALCTVHDTLAAIKLSKGEHSIMSIGYITRCRYLRDLHTEGRRPRGCVNREDTEPSDITDLYHGRRDHRDASLS